MIEEPSNGKMFDEFNVTISNLLEKSYNIIKKVKALKREKKLQSTKICEVMDQTRKVEDGKKMMEDDKRKIIANLDAKDE